MDRIHALLVLAMVTMACGAAVDETAKQHRSNPELVERHEVIGRSPELARIMSVARSITRGRSLFQTISERVMNFLGYGNNEDDYEYSEDYFYPNFDGQVLNNAGSSYIAYNPYSNNSPARDDNFEEEDEYSWGDFMFDAAIVAVPMALVLAAMPTGLFTIPIAGRSMDNDLEEQMKPYEANLRSAIARADFLSYTSRDCQERIFCEIVQIGRQKEASMLQKIFYLAANLTPEFYAKTYGVDKLLKLSREGKCEEYKCVPLMAPLYKKQSKAALTKS